MTKVAINGLGRIGRATLKILLEARELELVVVNDIAPPENLAYLLAYPHAAVEDLEMTKVVDGDLVKIMTWYDNEWGYAAQMVREAAARRS